VLAYNWEGILGKKALQETVLFGQLVPNTPCFGEYDRSTYVKQMQAFVGGSKHRTAQNKYLAKQVKKPMHQNALPETNKTGVFG
jgi:hypothetical protein